MLDHYRYWSLEAIVADLDARRHPFHVAIENWQHDLNIGTVVRTANAFNAAGVHIIGRRRWNRRGAMVTDRYLHVRHHETVAAFTEWAAGEGLPVLGVDLFPESVPVETFDFPRACVLVFGQEGPGLSAEVRAASSAVLSIAQYGSTRSINAGVAAGIALHHGEAAYGNVGSGSRLDFTVIGRDVKGSIHQVGAALEGAPSCNGWTYWHFRRDGKMIPIDILRQQIRAEMAETA